MLRSITRLRPWSSNETSPVTKVPGGRSAWRAPTTASCGSENTTASGVRRGAARTSGKRAAFSPGDAAFVGGLVQERQVVAGIAGDEDRRCSRIASWSGRTSARRARRVRATCFRARGRGRSACGPVAASTKSTVAVRASRRRVRDSARARRSPSRSMLCTSAFDSSVSSRPNVRRAYARIAGSLKGPTWPWRPNRQTSTPSR